jgi:diaminopimelate decarboxylase
MSASRACIDGAQEVRSGCRGVVPLAARLEPWMVALCRRPGLLSDWLDEHGSPLNVLDASPVARNAAELDRVARRRDLDFRIFFARKANKALAFVDEARRLGFGVDVASERELAQTLGRGVPGSDVIVTAAVKPQALVEACVVSGATVVIDNDDELERLVSAARVSDSRVPVALRLAATPAEGLSHSRFGFSLSEAAAALERCREGSGTNIAIVGVHFHLAGYAASDRVTAIGEGLRLVDALRARGHAVTFLDIGGGIPMSYLESATEWRRFWVEHRRGMLGERESLTFEGHGLTNVYPYFQEPTRGQWLDDLLSSPLDEESGHTVAHAIRVRGLQLRCEPGRSLLDGCGLTAARVEFRKQRGDGTWLIGVEMNRTQCRSTSDDFLVDPLLLRPAGSRDDTGAIEGYLVGAYCIERELLSWRHLHFPRGVEVGDIVVFPNTAGYLMHILESSSHQMPLARNLVVDPDLVPYVDPIDCGPESTA